MGQAVGTGNVWRFPRVATGNRRRPFHGCYMIALLVWAIPLLISEVVLGRRQEKVHVVHSVIYVVKVTHGWADGL